MYDFDNIARRKILRHKEFPRSSRATGKSAYIQSYIDIAGIAKSLMHGDEYAANTHKRRVILFCVYIKRHSLSARDNATMRRGGCLMYISLAFSRMTFDHRVVFKRFQRTTRALNDTSRLLSPFFFYYLAAIIFRCNSTCTFH